MMPAKMRLRLTVAAVVLTTGCTVSQPEYAVHRESRSVELGGARAVSVEVNLAAGELTLRGGAPSLLDANFRYGSPDWKPELKYNVVGSHGRLIIRHGHGALSGNKDSEWNLRLSDDVPLDVAVKMGAGSSRMDMGSLQLRHLEVEIGAGELKLDLTGHPRQDMDVRIRGGVGEATLRLPVAAAVDVEAHGGIGGINVRGLQKRGDKYVNAAFDTAKVSVHVSVHGGIGGINLICE